MNNKIDPIVSCLADTIKSRFREDIKDIILFGSRARGNARPDSDYDIIVLTAHWTKPLRDRISEIAWEMGRGENVSISIFVHESERFERDKYEPLFMNIRKEGVSI